MRARAFVKGSQSGEVFWHEPVSKRALACRVFRRDTARGEVRNLRRVRPEIGLDQYMIFRVENLEENQPSSQVTLPLVLRTTREKAEQVVKGAARIPAIMAFALFSGTITAAVVAIIVVAKDAKTTLLIAGLAIMALIVDLFLVTFVKKRSAATAATLSSDGATIFVVDQHGIKVGDKVLPRERITAVVYRRIRPEHSGAQTREDIHHMDIGLDQISSILPGGIEITPRPGTGNEAGSIGFTFNQFLSAEELPAFLNAVNQISQGFFPVAEINNAHWLRVRKTVGASRDEIKQSVSEYEFQQ